MSSSSSSSSSTTLSPQDRKIPVNISMPLRVLDVVDEYAFKLYGSTEGNRSKAIVDILKQHFKIK